MRILVRNFLFFIFFGISLFFVAGDVVGVELEDRFAITAAEKVVVLSKAEETLKWARSLPQESFDSIPAEVFRTKITPLELIQAAVILREQNKKDISVRLREIFSYFNPSTAECFDIVDRFSVEIESFSDDVELPQKKSGGGGGWEGAGLNSIDFIKKGAAKFMSDDLTAAEKIAIMDSPKTGIELMTVVDMLAVTGRASLTRHYLKLFLDTKITPAECADIVDKIGAARLMQISVNRQFAPRGEKAVMLIFNEAKKYWQDSEVIRKATDNLTIKLDRRSGGADRLSLDNFTPPVILPESLKSLQTIWKGEHVSAAQLLTKLANINDVDKADEVIAALLSIGGDVKEALAVSLNSDNTTLLKNAVRGLATSISQDEIFLLYPVAFSQKAGTPDEIKNEAYNIILSKLGGDKKNNIRNNIQKKSVQTLYKRARDYYSRNRHLRADEDGKIRFWNWNESNKSAEYIQLNVLDAYRLFAYRYAKLAYEIADKNGDDFDMVRRFYISALFEYISYIDGLDDMLDLDSSGLYGVVSSLPLLQLDRIMTEAIAEEHFEVARVAAALWGRVGNTASFISSAGGQPHPLIRAITAPDRRLRFAALETIMKLNPSSPFQGSSHVVDTLVWFAKAEGQKKVVVTHPKLSEASRFLGQLIPLGYSGELATTCRKGFIFATESPDVELIVVDSIFNINDVSEFVRLLRKDNRTYNIPVAIYSGGLQRKPKNFQGNPNTMELNSMQEADRLTPYSPFKTSLSQTYPRPANDEAAKFVEADLMRKTGAQVVPSSIRIEQAKKALYWIKQTISATKNGRKIYHYENLDEIVLRAMHGGVHVVEGLEIAVEIKSPNLQLAVYNVAADATLPIEIRKKAAQSFETSIKKHGILLRGKQIQFLYDRYNQTEHEPKESQDLLNQILDIIEEKASKNKF
ncbi:MAG: hypothetical protein LBP59_13330 [Planctomycetaceae bacterium]|jgi:hypothetical protein|nr:hypothetical protein [Planctomycetaceae bacterium]